MSELVFFDSNILVYTDDASAPKKRRVALDRETMQEQTHIRIPPDLFEEFEAAARRPIALRIRYGFIKTYKPVLDDVTFRSFDSMEQYRQWCKANLPDWLGYGRV